MAWCPWGLSAQPPANTQPKGRLVRVDSLPKGMSTSRCHLTSPLTLQPPSIPDLFCTRSAPSHSQPAFREAGLRGDTSLCPVPPYLSVMARNKPKVPSGGGCRDTLAGSRSFSASISSAASGTRVTGPPTNLLSAAFLGMAVGWAALQLPSLLCHRAQQQAGEGNSLWKRGFLERSNNQAPRVALMGSWLGHTSGRPKECTGEILGIETCTAHGVQKESPVTPPH